MYGRYVFVRGTHKMRRLLVGFWLTVYCSPYHSVLMAHGVHHKLNYPSSTSVDKTTSSNRGFPSQKSKFRLSYPYSKDPSVSFRSLWTADPDKFFSEQPRNANLVAIETLQVLRPSLGRMLSSEELYSRDKVVLGLLEVFYQLIVKRRRFRGLTLWGDPCLSQIPPFLGRFPQIGCQKTLV